jgi:hypothetical protein
MSGLLEVEIFMGEMLKTVAFLQPEKAINL